MDRIIEVKITGCHLTKSSNLAGVAGEANVTALRIEFDESWDGYAKTITWLNASGETATGVVLTVDMHEDTIKSTRVYIAPIPKAALTLAGETLFSVDGYMNGKRQRSVYGKLIVRQGGEFEAIDDVDSTTAEKIQLQLEGRLEEIQDALAGAKQAQSESAESAAAAGEYMKKAQNAKKDAETAMGQAQAAQAGAEAAKNSAQAARDTAQLSMVGAQAAMKSAQTSEAMAEAARNGAEAAEARAEAAADEAEASIDECLKRAAEYVDDTCEKLENKGCPNGYAPLDEFGKIPKKYLYATYGVSIDLSNSNPKTAVTYTDDAFGMVAGSDDWYTKPIFRNIKPCLFKNGAVMGYLNPNNFAQFEDGSAADITSGDAGDVMIEIPKTGYKISKSGTTLTVQITDDPNKAGFSYKAHTRAGEGDRENLYIGAFLGSKKDNKLRSVSGVAPLNMTTLTDFRTYAQANGAGYDLFAFYPLTLLQCLYLIMYKNLNSQAAIGKGYTGDTDWAYGAKNTGATVGKGMDYGTTNTMTQMKFLGIEDFWGNLYQWIDGLVNTKGCYGLVATDNFNDDGTGYTDIGRLTTSYVRGYMKEPQGNNSAGFIPKVVGGSGTTYFGDFVVLDGLYYDAYVPTFGGSFELKDWAGAFMLDIGYIPSIASDTIGGRLMFL